jgi:signal transduction histidine kinase
MRKRPNGRNSAGRRLYVPAKGVALIRAISDKKNAPADARRIEMRRERRLAALESLFRLVEKLGATLDVSEIANLLAAFMKERRMKRASLLLVDSGGRRLETRALAGEDSLPSIPLESAFGRWLAEAGSPVRVDEFGADAARAPGEDERTLRSLAEAGFSHAMALPGREGLAGVLVYGGVDGGDGLDDFDEDLCEMLARTASVSIENALRRERADASLRELERIDEAKRELIAGLAQDIRMPLAFLKNALWSLEPDEGGENVLVDMAKSEIGRLERKIEFVLSLSDVGFHERDFPAESADVSSIVEDILREKLPELEEKQVRVDLDDRAPFRKAFIDPGKLAIVIRSLVDKAVRGVGRDGTVAMTIRASEEPPCAEDGIAMDDQRGDAGPETHPPGSRGPRNADASSYLVVEVRGDGIASLEPGGSGLVISRTIVSACGGRLLASIDPGQGAQFSVWLPLGT